MPADDGLSLIAECDILQIHFWNDAALTRFLRAGLPARRLLLWAHVRGWTVPHILTSDLVGSSTFVVACDPGTLELQVLARHRGEQRIALAPAGVDLTRLSGLRRSRSQRVRVGYLGALDFTKLHRDFVSWCAKVRGDVCFVVAGEGPSEMIMRREARALGIEERFRFLGFVRDIREFFAQIDILGHPLDPESSAAGETCIQEAMAASVPPVVLQGAGGSFHVRDGETGLVAADGAAWIRAIESLAADPALRRRLGRAALAHSRAFQTAHRCAARFHEIYADAMATPKESHQPASPEITGAQAFAASLGPWGRPFLRSLRGGGGALAADRVIARCSESLSSARAGGLLHYRLAHPEDAHLRLWAGLHFEAHGRYALAASEYLFASRILADGRAISYLERVAAKAAGRPSLPTSREGS